MGLVAPHFQSFGIDSLAAASSDPILVPDFNITPAAILDIGRVPDFGRNGSAQRLRLPCEPSHARQIQPFGEPARMPRPGPTTRQHFGRQDLGRQKLGRQKFG
jgi:hypothetical protein